MGIIAWIIFGLIAGAIAKLIMPGNDGGGFILTCVLGVVGAVVGGWLATMFGFGGNISGFDMHSVRPNSHGLAGMRHRVEAAGGRLTVTSSLGDGTTISAVIPTAQSSIAA